VRKTRGLLLFLLAAALFVIANRGAYQGYFQDDEIDNISWAPKVPVSGYLETLVAPRFLEGNFRPVGHFYFAAAGKALGLDFPKYVIPIHAIHLLNVLLLWLLLRRLGADRFAASAGALFFAFHMAAFDVYWKPMYVFDLLCGTFSIACLLLYVRGNWVAALPVMWLAYKSKELAVMLPAVMLVYEYWLGERRWRRVLPFMAISVLFGVQGLLGNPHKDGEYAFRFSAGALAVTTRFYEARLLLLPFAGIAAIAFLALTRNRRVWFGLAAMLAFFAPLAVLPGRLFSAYTYVPLIGAAIAFSALARRPRAAFVALFFAVWLPWNVFHLRENRRSALTIAEENRRYIQSVGRFLREAPETEVFVYDGRPSAFHVWGIAASIRWFTGVQEPRLVDMNDQQAPAILKSPSMALLRWDPADRELAVISRKNGAPDASFLRMDRTTPFWQLIKGWYPLENRFRWIEPVAAARLYRPPHARCFEVTVNFGPELLKAVGPTRIEVFLDGARIGAAEFASNGWHTAQWDLSGAPPGMVDVEFRVSPGYQPSGAGQRRLGIAIGSFGFHSEEKI
jgi:hypothetical protein